jgi:hypothetical protein
MWLAAGKKQFYFMSLYDVCSIVGDAVVWAVSDLIGIGIFWICARLFLSVPHVIGEKQVVLS